ncbi:MAG: hypothetical protein JWO31_3254 [Phycisphaerales bacterium]|nr:hypothetical protein [Phycisphaerales bacterium]
MRRSHWLFALGGIVLCASRASAAVSYSYVTETPAIVSGAGSVLVKLYLQETLTAGSSSILSLEGGLGAGGVRVNITGSVPSSPARITGILANTAPGGFPSPFDESHSYMDGSASGRVHEDLLPDAAGGQPVVVAGSGGTVSRVLLYTLDIRPGDVVGQVTQFAISRYGTGVANKSTLTHSNFYDLDVSDDDATGTGRSPGTPAYTAATPSTFTVTTGVPEPGSAGLLLAGCGLLAARRPAGRARRT